MKRDAKEIVPGARITDVRVTQIDSDEEAEVSAETELPDDNE